jgi:hypothetical protein
MTVRCVCCGNRLDIPETATAFHLACPKKKLGALAPRYQREG